MRGTSTRWIGPLLAVALAVPAATAHGHPADWMYDAGGARSKQVGAVSGGVSMFTQREQALAG